VTYAAGLSSKLRSVPEPLILKAQLEVEMEKVKQKLETLPTPTLKEKIQDSLDSGRKQFLSAMEKYQKAKDNYSRAKRYWSTAMRREIRNEILKYSNELNACRKSWRQAMHLINGLSYSGAKNIVMLTALADIFKSH
jgi:septation ring formation regulator EzrA